VTPLFMVCVAMIVHALRERLPGYAFLVGLGGNLIVSLIVRGLHLTAVGYEPLAGWYVQLLQLNAVAFAAAGLLWLTARRRLYGERGSGLLLELQLGLGVVANALLLGGALVQLVFDPGHLGQAFRHTGEPWGWVALVTAAGACAWYAGTMRRSS